MPRFLSITLAAIWLLPPTGEADDARAKLRKDAIKAVDLRVERTGWGKARHDDLSAVLKSSCSELAVHFDGATLKRLEPIRIKRGSSGPITHYQRTIRGEIVVLLNSKDNFWCQHAYQMAHEFSHILCRFRKGDRSNLWFEESLCELASIFAIRGMAESWKTDPPYRNWRDYSKSLDDYANDLIEKYRLPNDVSLASYYRTNAGALSGNATDRSRNGKVAVKLLPMFEANPENWRAVFYLNVGRGAEKQSFKSYLSEWHRNCPAEHKAFVAQLGKEFGVIE